MVTLAWRNLIHERTRMAIGVGGIALATLLILLINGIFVGAEQSMVTYINRQPAPLWLMQTGVENMHMAYSMLPPGTIERVMQVAGVRKAVGVLYIAANAQIGDTLVPSYIFGIEPDEVLGGPWALREGSAALSLNQVVIDAGLARRYGLNLGDSISIRGFSLKIAGLSEGTFGFGSNIVFVNKTAMALGMGMSPQSASYILVQPAPGTDVNVLAEQLRSAVPDASLLTQTDFAESDMELARKMGSDVIRVMNVVAYVIGLLVISITIYTLTLERTREYGVLKAIGAQTHELLSIVFIQAFASAGVGYILGIVLAYLAGALVQRLSMTVIVIEPAGVLSQLPALAAVTGIAALLPIGRVLQLDPMLVFQS